MLSKVQKILDEIRPSIQLDGGDIELVDVTGDGIVKVRLQGHCAHCPMSSITLKMNVEARLKKEIPEIKEVVAVD
jgi:Fe-S cluster biogenesis protein NfuA